MSTKGFTFTCPSLDHHNGDIESFFIANPSDVYNPYPQIARRDSLYQARTQPLVRIRYEPWPNGAFDPEKLNKILELAHEQGHVDNDDTPAKSRARFIQGVRFRNLDSLIWSEKWNANVAKVWTALCKGNELLSSIADRIVISEELLATAESFVKMGKYADWQPTLKALEEASVSYYTKLFPDFRTLYFETIKKVMVWATPDEETLISKRLDFFIRVFLQGLSFHKELGGCVDSHQQCLLLAEYVKTTDNPAHVSDWLIKIVRQEEFIYPWLAYLHMQANDHSGTVAEPLWQVTRARITEKGKFGPIPKGVDLNCKVNFFDRDRPSIVLYPRLLGTQWRIQPGELLLDEGPIRIGNNKYIESKPVQVTLKAEALLEQLEERDGICCPYYGLRPDMPEACGCHPEWKVALLRLLQWGREGKFGPGGTWRDLPPECCSGV